MLHVDHVASLLQSSFTVFVCNPPILEEGSSSSHRLWFSSDEIEAIVATHQDMPEEDKQTHILIQQPTGDSEIEGVLGMLAEESSKLARLKLGCGAPKQSSTSGKRVDNLASPWSKRPGQSDAPTDVLEVKKKRKLLCSLDMQPVSGQAEQDADNDVVDVGLMIMWKVETW